MKGYKKVKSKGLNKYGYPKAVGQFIAIHMCKGRVWAETYRVTSEKELEVYNEFTKDGDYWEKVDWCWVGCSQWVFYKAKVKHESL